jgi:hypothetical protein
VAERAAAGPFELTLFDGAIDAGWSWSQRDEAMAARILASGGIGTLAVAGNAHTPVSHTELGVPMGAYLAQRRPGVQEIRINYCGGYFYSFQPVRFAPTGPHRAKYGSMSTMTRLLSTCPQPAKRSCPSDLSRARPCITHPDGG